MLRDDAITRIKRKLSWRTGTAVDSHIVQVLQDAQRVIENSGLKLPNGLGVPVPWYLEVVDYAIPLVAGTLLYALPTNYLKELEDFPPYALDTEGTRLELIKTIPNAAETQLVPMTGPPQVYYHVGTQIKVLPEPDDAYVLYLSYVKQDLVLESNIENGHLKYVPELLIGVAGEEIANDLRDKEAITAFQKMALKGMYMLWDQKFRRETSNRRSAIGVVR